MPINPNALFLAFITLFCLLRIISGHRTSIVLTFGLSLLVFLGLLSPSEAFSGFSSEPFLTIVFFLVFSKGLENTGLINLFIERLFRTAKTTRAGMLRTMGVCFFRCFLGNTAMVSLLLSPVKRWSRLRKFSEGALLIPLTFSCSVGGLNCLVATSTNLVILGVAQEFFPEFKMGIWDIALWGLPLTLVTTLYFLGIPHRWFPESVRGNHLSANPREYTVEFIVDRSCPLIGSSVEASGLRNLSGVYLAEVYREEAKFIGPMKDFIFQSGDQLVFVGAPENISELLIIPELRLAQTRKFGLGDDFKKHFYEAVLSNHSHLVGKTPKVSQFREAYGAVILSIFRDGKRLTGKIGDLIFQGGDCLLVESHRNLSSFWKKSRDFFFVQKVQSEDNQFSYSFVKRATLITVFIFFLLGSGILTPFKSAVLGCFLIFLFGCAQISEVFNRMDWETLISIGLALGLSSAWSKYYADLPLDSMSLFFQGHPFWLLIIGFSCASILTEFLQNNTAGAISAAILFPLVKLQGISPLPFVVGLMVASSCSFITSLGYQTNLMVMGAGGYKESDFFKIGLGLKVLTSATFLISAYFIF